MSNEVKKTIVVFVCVRYGQVLGVYQKQDDAMIVVNDCINRGQACDMIVKPLL